MFTGLIEAVGKIESVTSRGNYKVLTVGVEPNVGQFAMGESICCDGACLTVVAFTRNSFTVEISQESLARTTLSSCRVGSHLNLERALKVGDRLGGHFVTGHIDAVGTTTSIQKIGESIEIVVGFEPSFRTLVVEKGSVAINGTSLTVNKCGDDWLSVNIIPHTLKATTLGELKLRDRVNLEFDIIGKYVLRAAGKETTGDLTMEKLLSSGW
jgi:riboflavin synthase